MLLKNIMLKAKMLSDYLQGETIDTAGALVALSTTNDVLKRIPADDNEINKDPATASMLSDLTYLRCEFFKLIDFLISTLGQKYQSLANVFHPFLKVIHTKAPGNMVDIKIDS